ncbi:MAG: hypothetical protein AB8G18_07205 [Gammaproteobacteria bacterium]
MNLNATTLWALISTTVAVLLTGVFIGKSLPTPVASPPTPAASEPGGEMVANTFEVPQWLVNAPKEWQSKPVNSNTGHAILLDYERRELLVEQCQHLGYFNAETNLPRERKGLECTRLLTGTLLEFNETGVLVQTRDGRTIEAELDYIQNDALAQLGLRFDRHTMQLRPGQLNDLAQEFEQTANVKAEAQLFIDYEYQLIKQRRAIASAGQEQVPAFALPLAAREQDEADRLSGE